MTIVRLNRIPRVNAWRAARPTARAWSDTARDGQWPATVLVLPTKSPYRVQPCPPCTGDCAQGRQCPAPAKLHPAAAALAWFLGIVLFLAGCAAMVASVVLIGWVVAVVLPAVLNALGVAMLHLLGVL